MTSWKTFFEGVLVPMAGLIGVIAAAAGAPVPIALYPVLAGMIGYPGFRALDKVRNGNEKK